MLGIVYNGGNMEGKNGGGRKRREEGRREKKKEEEKEEKWGKGEEEWRGYIFVFDDFIV